MRSYSQETTEWNSHWISSLNTAAHWCLQPRLREFAGISFHEKRENINQPREVPTQVSLSAAAEHSGAREGTKTLQQRLNSSQIASPMGNPGKSHHTQLLTGSYQFPHGQDNPVLPESQTGLQTCSSLGVIHFHMDRTTPESQKRASNTLQAQLG